jgi:hypothetical protein
MSEDSRKIFTHERWGARDMLERAGIHVTVARDHTDTLSELPEPQYGEYILGELNDLEKELYVDLHKANKDFELLQREYLGRQVERFGQSIRTADLTKEVSDIVKSNKDFLFDSEEEKKNFFRLERHITMLKGHLHWSLAERFMCHDFTIGVRSKFRAVKGASRA